MILGPDARVLFANPTAAVIPGYGNTSELVGKPSTELSLSLEGQRELFSESESEKRFRELADLLPQIVFETDEKGSLTFGNRAGFGITGYSQSDIDKGPTALDLFSKRCPSPQH